MTKTYCTKDERKLHKYVLIIRIVFIIKIIFTIKNNLLSEIFLY